MGTEALQAEFRLVHADGEWDLKLLTIRVTVTLQELKDDVKASFPKALVAGSEIQLTYVMMSKDGKEAGEMDIDGQQNLKEALMHALTSGKQGTKAPRFLVKEAKAPEKKDEEKKMLAHCDVLGRGVFKGQALEEGLSSLLSVCKERILPLSLSSEPNGVRHGSQVPDNVDYSIGPSKKEGSFFSKDVKLQKVSATGFHGQVNVQLVHFGANGQASSGNNQSSGYKAGDSREVDVLYVLNLKPDPLPLEKDLLDSLPTWYDPSRLATFLNKYGSHVIKMVQVGSRAQQHDVSAQGSLSSSADRKATADLGAASPTGDGGAVGFTHESHQGRDTSVKASKSSSILEGRADEGFVMVEERGLQPIYELLDEEDPRRTFLEEAVGFLDDAGASLWRSDKHWSLRYFLDFRRGTTTSSSKPPGAREGVLPLAKMGKLELRVNPNEATLPPCGVPTGVRLEMQGQEGHHLGLGIQHSNELPELFVKRGFNPTEMADGVPASHRSCPLQLSIWGKPPLIDETRWVGSKDGQATVLVSAKLVQKTDEKGHQVLSLATKFAEVKYATIRGDQHSDGWLAADQTLQLMSLSLGHDKPTLGAGCDERSVNGFQQSARSGSSSPRWATEDENFVTDKIGDLIDQRMVSMRDESPFTWVVTGLQLKGPRERNKELSRNQLSLRARFSILAYKPVPVT